MSPRSRLTTSVIGLMAAVLIVSSLCAAQIPPPFINSVVALGGPQTIKTPGLPDRVEWTTSGTGFFYGYLVENDSDPTKRKYETYLVTAKHVVQGHLATAGRGDMKVRINPKEPTTKIQEFPIPSAPKLGENTWFYHPDPSIDIAAVQVNLNSLKQIGYEPDFFTNDIATMNRKSLALAEASAGDGVFVLGFPMNLAGAQKTMSSFGTASLHESARCWSALPIHF